MNAGRRAMALAGALQMALRLTLGNPLRGIRRRAPHAAREVLLATALALAMLAGSAGAREFRQFSPIATPESPPEGAEPVARFVPVDRALVERAVHALARAWNGGALDPLLAPDFVDRSRLRDVIAEVVPRDALLRVLAIEGVNTLDQYRVRGDDGRWRRVSTVAVVVLTQVEFNDPRTGFQRLQGRNELYFRVEQPHEAARR